MHTPDLESVLLVRRSNDDLRICVTALITAHKASLAVTFNEVQSHHFAGGNVFNLGIVRLTRIGPIRGTA